MGQEVIKISRIESGRVRRCWKSHGSRRVGSGQEVDKSHPRKVTRPVKSPATKYQSGSKYKTFFLPVIQYKRGLSLGPDWYFIAKWYKYY